MVSPEDGRKAADEIAAMLAEMTPEQKVRAKDVISGMTLMNTVSAKNKEDGPVA